MNYSVTLEFFFIESGETVCFVKNKVLLDGMKAVLRAIRHSYESYIMPLNFNMKCKSPKSTGCFFPSN